MFKFEELQIFEPAKPFTSHSACLSPVYEFQAFFFCELLSTLVSTDSEQLRYSSLIRAISANFSNQIARKLVFLGQFPFSVVVSWFLVVFGDFVAFVLPTAMSWISAMFVISKCSSLQL